MSTTITPNMSLPVPVQGQESGPQYATDINNCMSIIDQHNHTPGNGVLITPAAININVDLPMGSNNLTLTRSIRFAPQSVAITASSPDLGCLYEAGVDLYYNDGNGNQIRITQSGSVAGSTGTITGLPSGTASAAYSSGSGTFVFQSATNTPANLSGASLIIAQQTASPNNITLSSPNSLAGSYTITLPTALPGSKSIVTLTSAGTMSAEDVTDETSLTQSAGVISIKNGGVTPAKLAPLTTYVSSSSGTFTMSSTSFVNVTNLNVSSVVTTGRPVRIEFQPDGSTSNIAQITSNNGQIDFQIVRDATVIALFSLGAPGGTYQLQLPSFTDVVTAGTYNYQLQARNHVGGGQFLTIENTVMVVYQV